MTFESHLSVVSDSSTATVVTPRRAVDAIACRVPNSSEERVPNSGQLNIDAGVDIIKVKERLGHRHGLKEGASHDVPN